MFTPETIIDTVETAKLNAIEKVVSDSAIKENIKATIRAEAQFAKTLVATTKNVANEVVNFKYENLAATYTKFVTNFFDLSKKFSVK